MSTYLTEQTAVESVLSAWDVDDAQIAWDNSGFVPTTGTPWIRPQIEPVDAQQIEIGPTAQTRYTGLVVVDVFTPAGEGPAGNMTLAQTLADLFRRQTVTGVRFGNPRYRRIGNGSDTQTGSAGDFGPWFMGKVEVPFYRNSTT